MRSVANIKDFYFLSIDVPWGFIEDVILLTTSVFDLSDESELWFCTSPIDVPWGFIEAVILPSLVAPIVGNIPP